jgi:DNA ligase-1
MIKKIVILFLFLPFVLLADKPNLLLLKTYKDQNISGWVMSEKLDGIRAYWDGEHLISRGGKIIYTPAWFTKNYPPFEIDGELWSKRDDFSNISLIVCDKIPSDKWHEIKHYIFEVPHVKGGLFERLERVKPYEDDIIKLIPQKEIKSKKELQRFLKDVEAKGGEGVVVRDPNAPYAVKRTSKALKVKSFKDAECEVVGYTKGRGKFEGKVWALRCRLQNNIVFYVGSGLSDKERKNPPKIGTIITFKYKEMAKKLQTEIPNLSKSEVLDE